ncbi:MAG: NAD(P)H-binding protein, partial [Acidimicrobiaceae bacterium]|nr:NAD(P)H-binding protein [Acidimicrobiaceae bacterium]
MRVALFGATGTVGTQVLTQALEHGHEVQALVRDPGRLPVTATPVTVVTGDVHDQEAVDAVVAGSDAVLSALGGTNRSAPHLLGGGTANVLDAMNRLAVSRIVVVQGFQLPFPGDPNNAGQRLIRRILRLANAALL